MEKIKERLESRVRTLKSHIELDQEWVGDNFIGQFMEGRIYIENMWLEEVESLLRTANFSTDVIIPVLIERRAILKTYLAEEKERFNSTDGQEMRGRHAINSRWLEETESLLEKLNGIRG